MKSLALLAVIGLRVAMNDGLFLEQRRMPARQQSKDLRAAIMRTWKRGSKRVF
ncbi:MAG: hypothetical protein ACO3D4_04015 [Vulcanococcus sp.]